MDQGRPEIALSDVVDSCAVDAAIVVINRQPNDVEKKMRQHFLGNLAEEAFAIWTGIPRRRPRLGEPRDHGDVPLGGSVKGAPYWHDVPGRKDQNWAVDAGEFNRASWVVFVTVEMGRDLGPANELQIRLGRTDLGLRRWIEEGRWREPIGTIWGWLTPVEISALGDPEDHTHTDKGRSAEGWHLVNWRSLKTWPEHPRPTTPAQVRELLGINVSEDDKATFLDSMRRSVEGAGPL